jgi:hypothetical protein
VNVVALWQLDDITALLQLADNWYKPVANTSSWQVVRSLRVYLFLNSPQIWRFWSVKKLFSRNTVRYGVQPQNVDPPSKQQDPMKKCNTVVLKSVVWRKCDIPMYNLRSLSEKKQGKSCLRTNSLELIIHSNIIIMIFKKNKQLTFSSVDHNS